MRKPFKALLAGVLLIPALAACSSQADVASQNLSTAADNYQIFRQIVVEDTWTNTNVEVVYGYCSMGNNDPAGEVTFTCKSDKGIVKDIIYPSTNTLVVEHQMHPVNVSTNFYKVIIRPQTLVPDFQIN